MNTLFDTYKDLRLGCTIKQAIALLGEKQFNEHLNTKELEIIDSLGIETTPLVYATSFGVINTAGYLKENGRLEYLKQDSRL
jgi:hypothetical protein